MSSKFSSSEAISFGWKTTTSNLGFFITLMLITFGISMVIGSISLIPLIKDSSSIKFLYEICRFVISGIITLGSAKIFLDFVRSGKSNINELFNNYDQIFMFIGATILFYLIVFVGLILLIVPGIILAIKYGFYVLAIADKKMSPVDALKFSGEITNGEKMDLFAFGLLCMGINFLGMLCLFIGLIVTIPTTYLAVVYVYNKLINKEPVVVPVTPIQNEVPQTPAV